MGETKQSVAYRPETAGAVMDISVPVIDVAAVVQEVEDLLIATAADFATINYVYVKDEHNALVGVLSIRELFRTEKTTRVAEVMQTQLVTVGVDVDQEEVARLAIKHSIKAMPVVDVEGHLLGVVAMDTILEIVNHEITEDFLRIAGATTDDISAVELIGASPYIHFWKRLPWLVVGLLGGTFAAMVVSRFEGVMEAHVAVAAFIPLIVYLSGAVSSQIQLIFIRSLALRPSLQLLPYFWREVKINVALAAALALTIIGVSYIWVGDPALSIVLSMSVFATVCAAMCVGVVLPWFFHKNQYDPAIASGPFATVVTDVMSLAIYFLIASSLLAVL